MKKQSSGYYRTKVKIGTDATGKPVNKWISAKTKKELEDKKRDVVSIYITGEKAADDQLFASYIRAWFDAYKRPRIRASTVRSYDNLINRYLIPAFGDRNLRSITPTDIQMYANSLAGKCQSTVGKAISTLNAVFAAAVRDRIITINPVPGTVAPESKPKKEKHVLTPEERAMFTSAAETHKDGLMIGILYYTGARIGECCGLEWGDIDFRANTIHIRRSVHRERDRMDLKTKTSDRIIPIAPQLLSLLQSVPQGLPSTPVLCHKGKHFTVEHADVVWCNVMLAIGLAHKGGKNGNHIIPNFYPHVLRHNFLTLCYEGGIDPFTASKLAGHAKIQTTMDIYTHLSESHLQNVGKQVAAMFAAK